MRIRIGNGGWVGVDDLGLPGPLYVRMTDRDGRLRVGELYLDAGQAADAIDVRDLRDLPLPQLEALINVYADKVRERAGYASPDLSTLASYYATGLGSVARQVAEGDWVAASFAAQFPQEIRDDAGVNVKRVERAPGSRKGWLGLRAEEREFRLSAGPTEGLTADFLQDVARAYRAAVLRGEHPNAALAEQTGYPLKTAQRWVYTARERRIMPRAGTKGRAG